MTASLGLGTAKYCPATAAPHSTEIPGLSLNLETAEQKPVLLSPAFLIRKEILTRTGNYCRCDPPTHPFAVLQPRVIRALF